MLRHSFYKDDPWPANSAGVKKQTPSISSLFRKKAKTYAMPPQGTWTGEEVRERRYGSAGPKTQNRTGKR